MSTHNKSHGIYGIDPAIIEAAIRRGRLERSQAFWAMLQAIFGRPAAKDGDASLASGKGAHAHC